MTYKVSSLNEFHLNELLIIESYPAFLNEENFIQLAVMMRRRICDVVVGDGANCPSDVLMVMQNSPLLSQV